MLTDRKGEPTDVSKANSQGYLNMFVFMIIDYKFGHLDLLDKIKKKVIRSYHCSCFIRGFFSHHQSGCTSGGIQRGPDIVTQETVLIVIYRTFVSLF